MAFFTSRRLVAYAPVAAFALTSALLFLGLVGVFVTAGLVMATSADDVAPFMAAVTQIGFALLAAFTSCALGGFGGLVMAGQSRAGVDPDGRFRVQSWPPGRVRTIDLAGLERVVSRRGPLRRKGLLAPIRHSTTLSLRDHTGATAEWNPAFWRGSEPVAAALREAVLATGATVDHGAAQVLDHPPFGSR
ncbi:MAG TPA: hypothetical protein VM324_00420 [Egibacteraceae bacterium]|jgi:hypothetical protein|nr:hypothetical protein [Egibacteraceae bacterium]